MKVQHPLLALCVYLGVGFFLYLWGVRVGTMVIVCLTCGVVLYSFLASMRR